jgi:hypothetical protein
MIVGSVLLVVVAGVLLGVGLVRLDPTLLYASIGVSALAALALAVGVRRAATVRAGNGTIAVRRVVPTPRVALPAAEPLPPRPVGRARVVPLADVADDRVAVRIGAAEEIPEAVDAQDLSRARGLEVTVLVDRRPWFHRVDCGFVLGPSAAPMSAAQAIELGAAPCGRCRPVTTLLADIDTAAGGPGD